MKTNRLPRTVARLVVATVLVISALAGVARAQAQGTTPVTTPNPDFRATCGANVVLVLDESSSIGRFPEKTAQVRAAAAAFADGLKDTGSKLAVVEFSSVATTAIGFTPVTSATIGGFTDYFDAAPGAPAGGYSPWTMTTDDSYTNWQDALRTAGGLDPGAGEAPPVIVFVTDGDPTAYFTSEGQIVRDWDGTGLPQAVAAADAVKAQGKHILAVAVGSALDNAGSLDRLRAITDGDQSIVLGQADVAGLNLATDDVLRVTDFAVLPQALLTVSRDLCRSEVTIRKVVDRSDGLAPVAAEGWRFTGTLSRVPDMWVLPADATGTTATAVTADDGVAVFKWRSVDPAPTDLTVTEAQRPDHTLASVVCRTNDGPGVAVPVGSGDSFRIPDVGDTDRVDCTVTNVFAARPAIAVEKAAAAPTVQPGGTATWWIAVTNTGNTPLSDVAVSDPAAPGCAVYVGTLAVGERRDGLTCTTANVTRNMTNVATATGTYGTTTVSAVAQASVTVTPLAPSPGDVMDIPTTLAITKTGPPAVRSGRRITYTVRVRNTGTSEARKVVIVDRIPQGMSFVGASARTRLVRGRVQVDVGILAPGRTRTVRFTFRVDTRTSGQRTNLAFAAAENARGVRAAARTKIVKVAGVSRTPRVIG